MRLGVFLKQKVPKPLNLTLFDFACFLTSNRHDSSRVAASSIDIAVSLFIFFINIFFSDAHEFFYMPGIVTPLISKDLLIISL